MARSRKNIETYTHPDKERVNNPPSRENSNRLVMISWARINVANSVLGW